ncbi:MAG: DUF2092 domain-containing protein [Terracidiphilus sp.]
MNITLASAGRSNVEAQDQSLGWRRAALFSGCRIRRVLVVTVVGVLLGYLSPSQLFAKSGKQADSDKAPAIDPSAMQALDKMGAYLRTLHSFQVKADMTTDDVLEDGEAIQSSSTVNLVASRPNRLRAEFVGDDGHRFFFFDGKNFTIYGQITNYYATVPAPPTITELIQKLGDKYAIQLPLVDLFEWGTKDSDINKIKAAQDVGPSAVDGVTCEQYAFRQENLDWQVWIQMGEFPLPRKIVIRTLTDDAKPQHSEVLSWNLAPSFSDDAFTFDPPPDAKRIKIAEIKSEPAEGNQ